MVGETPEILTFEVDSLVEHPHAARVRGHSKPHERKSTQSWLNELQVSNMLDPEAPIEAEDSLKSTKNLFKATFGEIAKYDCMVVVCLPSRVPDNLCHFAAQEATMVIDQFLKPDFESLA